MVARRGRRGVRPGRCRDAPSRVALIALRMSRIDERPEDRDDDRGDEALTSVKPICWASQPPTIPPRMPTTMFGRQPRAVRPPTSAPEIAPGDEADDDPADEAISMVAVMPWAASHGRGSRDRRDDEASGWVWWAACFAPVDRRRSGRRASRASRARVASPNDRQALAAEDLEDRLTDRARAPRGRRPGRVSARSSRTIVGAAATRRGQTGFGAVAREIRRRSCPTTSRMNVGQQLVESPGGVAGRQSLGRGRRAPGTRVRAGGGCALVAR